MVRNFKEIEIVINWSGKNGDIGVLRLGSTGEQIGWIGRHSVPVGANHVTGYTACHEYSQAILYPSWYKDLDAAVEMCWVEYVLTFIFRLKVVEKPNSLTAPVPVPMPPEGGRK